MSVAYDAAIVVGRPYDEIEDKLKEFDNPAEGSDWYDYVTDRGLERLSPYYDAPDKHCLVGYIVQETPEFWFEELVNDEMAIEQAMDKFFAVFGVRAKVYLTPTGG